MDGWHPEYRHHGVADVFLDGAAVVLDDVAHLVEIARHETAQRLGIYPFADSGRADRVYEHDGYCLADLVGVEGSGGLEGRTAVRTEPRVLGVFTAAP